MTHVDNRPERCGQMRSALTTIEIAADSALKFYEDPDYHNSLLMAMREVSRLAAEYLARDAELVAVDRAAFEAWMNRDGRCTTCNRSAHWGPDAPGPHGHPYASPADATETAGE